VFEEGNYIYIGEVELAEIPYIGRQPDIDGELRNVYIFPLKLKSGEKRLFSNLGGQHELHSQVFAN
jgi:5-methylcytosine-specific restriction protein A